LAKTVEAMTATQSPRAIPAAVSPTSSGAITAVNMMVATEVRELTHNMGRFMSGAR